MSIRTVCFILAIVFRNTGLWPYFIAGAIVLPYVAVVLANAGASPDPGGMDPYVPERPELEGTPQALARPLDGIDFVRMIAVARITMPKSMVRLSAGREEMSDETQALCFLAGANSIFYGARLLTTPNPVADQDRALFGRLGISLMPSAHG